MRFPDIRPWFESEKYLDQQLTILNRLDFVFGSIMNLFIIAETYFWWTGKSSVYGPVMLMTMMVLNIAASQLVYRFPKYRLMFVLVRSGIINQVMAASLVFVVDGPLSPFWLLYMVNAAGAGPDLFSLKSNRLLVLIQGLNLLNFLIVAAFYPHGTIPAGTIVKLAAVLLVTACITEVVISILRTTLRQQLDLGLELEEGAKKETEQQEFIQGFIDHFPGIAFAKNTIGQFTLTNQSTEKMLGTSLIGKTESDLAQGSVLAALNLFERRRLDSGASVVTEETIYVNGRPSHFVTTRFRLFQNGEPAEECAIGVDITHQRLAETEFEQSKANMISRSKMSALGEMAGGIAHEINNPLAIILGKAQRIFERDETEPVDFATVQKDAAKIMQITERIAKITSALRSFARDDNNAPFANVKIENICSETLALCSERFRNRGIRIIDSFSQNGDVIQLHSNSAASDLRVECRAAEISQVLLHLLNNAYDAVQHKPNPWIRISVTDAGKSIDISVMDSGEGIAISQREKIFQPFFTTKPIGQATGLGLSIVDGIVGAHGGRLWLDTHAACTSFVIRLPKVQPNAKTVRSVAA